MHPSARADRDLPDRDPRVINLGADNGAAVRALASETARSIVARVRETPATAPELAEEVDTSVQNVHYHLEKLTDANVLTAVDTVYSEKGREMNVYAPAGDPLVIVTADRDSDELESLLARVLSAAALLAVGSVLVQRLLVPAPEFVGGPNMAGYVDSGPALGLAVFAVGSFFLLVYTALRIRQIRGGNA